MEDVELPGLVESCLDDFEHLRVVVLAIRTRVQVFLQAMLLIR